MNVHAFPDLRLSDAGTSLERLTKHARSLNVFGADVDFDAPVWELTDVKRAKPSQPQTNNLYFTRIAASETRSMEGREPFEPAFGKSRQDHHRTSRIQPTGRPVSLSQDPAGRAPPLRTAPEP